MQCSVTSTLEISLFHKQVTGSFSLTAVGQVAVMPVNKLGEIVKSVNRAINLEKWIKSTQFSAMLHRRSTDLGVLRPHLV